MKSTAKILSGLTIALFISIILSQAVLLSSSFAAQNTPKGVPEASASHLTNLNVTLHGAGATFPAPLISLWATQYHSSFANTTIAYQAIGSGKGIASLINKTGDFAASDAPLNTNQRILAPDVLHIPETIGSVVPAYNLVASGITTGLNFTGDLLARIYLGNITKWNDPALQAISPGVVLPNNSITVVHRSDGSGTTFVWTSYLSLSNAIWKATVGSGTTVLWPVGVGAAGNPGISQFVNNTANTIGYVELNYALTGSHNTFGAVRNSDNTKYVLPSLSTTTFAVENYTATHTLPSGSASWSGVSMLNQAGPNTYPIASFTYLLVYKELNVIPGTDFNETAQAQTLLKFLNWVITTGQSYSAGLFYVPLPASVVAVDQASINSITFTVVSTPVHRTINLSADSVLGWNNTIPGPKVQVVSGDQISLNLISHDSLPHRWYIDWDNNGMPDAIEANTTSPSFSSPTTPLHFDFTPVIWLNLPSAGSFTYRLSDNSAISGTIVVLPQQTAAVFRPPSTLTSSFSPVMDTSRVTTIGSLIVDSRTQVVSGNITVATVDSVSGSLTFAKGFIVPQLQMTKGMLRFILVAAVSPYPVSSDITVQTTSLASTAARLITRNLDLNNQGSVNILDISSDAIAFNTVLGQPGYNPKADVDGNGDVSIIDLSISALYFDSTALY